MALSLLRPLGNARPFYLRRGRPLLEVRPCFAGDVAILRLPLDGGPFRFDV